jgi:hypothetical protein
MPPVGFEPTISAGERPQTHALDRAGTGIDFRLLRELNEAPYSQPAIHVKMRTQAK